MTKRHVLLIAGLTALVAVTIVYLCLSTPQGQVFTVKPLADRYVIGSVAVERLQHGGDDLKTIVQEDVVFEDGAIGHIFRLGDKVLRTEEEHKPGRDGKRGIKSSASFADDGKTVIEGAVFAADGSKILDFRQSPGKDRLMRVYWPGGRLYCELSTLEGPTARRTMTWYRQEGGRCFVSELVKTTGSWSQVASEQFRLQDGTRELRIEMEGRWGSERKAITYRGDGQKILTTSYWKQAYDQVTQRSFRITGLEERNFSGAIARVLVFDESSGTVKLSAVQLPVSGGTQVIKLDTEGEPDCKCLIESWKQWDNKEVKRELAQGKPTAIETPQGKQPAEGVAIKPVAIEHLLEPAWMPKWFDAMRKQFSAAQTLAELGTAKEGDPCRWYLTQD